LSNRVNVLIGLAAVAVGFLLAGTAVAQISDEPDAEIEECLNEGKVVKKEGRLVGVTNPNRYKIECNGEERSVVFKHLDEHRRGVTRLPQGGSELNFSDSYKYEVAAYRLDRELGMNMVPVAVLRKVRGDHGCFVAWIDNASNQKELAANPTGQQMAYLAGQKATMRLFDALIYNTDRRPENWMVNHDTFKLYLIDHSRAFRQDNELPESFANRRTRLTSELYEQLLKLNQEELAEMLDGLITNTQLEAMLERRDLIIGKIDKDRQEYGDAAIFSDWESSEAALEGNS